MTVGELIQRLQQVDPLAQVEVEDSDLGYGPAILEVVPAGSSYRCIESVKSTFVSLSRALDDDATIPHEVTHG